MKEKLSRPNIETPFELLNDDQFYKYLELQKYEISLGCGI